MGPFLFCFFFVSVWATVTVQPSNNSHDFPGLTSDRFHLQAFGALNNSSLVPLTQALLNLSDSDKQAVHITGNLTKVVAEDSIGLNASSIACIPCDSSDYPGPLKAANTIETVDSASNRPAAIILYSESATHCNFSSDEAAESYRYIFTVVNSQTSSALQQIFDTDHSSATISMGSNYGGIPDSSGSTGSTSGDSPNTAMIILYSITGIITALFLGIIITGAVRAHRHPERYGPRRIAGRPRQSRARGIARAMLEGIPIVKFGDEPPRDGVEAAKRDIEMASDNEGREHSPSPSEDGADVHHTTPSETEITPHEHGEDESAAATAPKTDAAPVTEAGNFSCPICTDDFIKGQDLRVLPCSHQFHPECVDPWLLTVSGTCPLCRIDLNPSKEGENAEQDGENAEHTEETPAEEPASPTADPSSHRHNRFTNYLNARRMRNASVEERLAALRHVRAANQSSGATAPTNRRGLSIRLRERFRVRTRAHGVETTDDSGASTPVPPVPAVPSPAHVAEHPAETENTH